MMINKNWISVFIIFILSFLDVCLLSGCQMFNNNKINMDDMILLEKVRDIQYAESFGMKSDNEVLYCIDLTSRLQSDENKDKDIIFVLNKPDINNEEHIVIFPTETTEIYLKNYNEYIEYQNVDLTPYNLTYPLTMSDILQNRNEMTNLIKDTPEADKELIFSEK